jgi:hypothetical protein
VTQSGEEGVQQEPKTKGPRFQLVCLLPSDPKNMFAAAASYKMSGRLMAVGTIQLASALTAIHFRDAVDCEAPSLSTSTARLKSSSAREVNLRKRVRCNIGSELVSNNVSIMYVLPSCFGSPFLSLSLSPPKR